jgi:hypothetical protein
MKSIPKVFVSVQKGEDVFDKRLELGFIFQLYFHFFLSLVDLIVPGLLVVALLSVINKAIVLCLFVLIDRGRLLGL